MEILIKTNRQAVPPSTGKLSQQLQQMRSEQINQISRDQMRESELRRIRHQDSELARMRENQVIKVILSK